MAREETRVRLVSRDAIRTRRENSSIFVITRKFRVVVEEVSHHLPRPRNVSSVTPHLRTLFHPTKQGLKIIPYKD